MLNILHRCVYWLLTASLLLFAMCEVVMSSQFQTTAFPKQDSLSFRQRQPYGVNYFGKSAFSRNVLQDAAFAGKTFVKDGLWIYSSPTRFNKRSALLFGGVLAIGVGLYFADDVISDGLRRNSEYWAYEPFRKTGNAVEPVGRQATMNKYVFGSAMLCYIVGFERGARMFSEILESYLIAGLPKVAANRIAGRPRPLDGKQWNYWEAFGGGQSFYSGHASHAFQIARIIDEHVRFLPLEIALYTAATSVGVQRVSSGWHWASDVWLGGVYGLVVADAITGCHRKQWPTIQPMSFNSGTAQGVNMVVNF